MFKLNEIEQKRASEFIKTHRVEKTGCSGGQFSYIFTPTTIGCGVSIKDNISKEEENITDYNNW